MATGITKKGQHSIDAISAVDYFSEPLPLPADTTEVSLSYTGKANESKILKYHHRQFYQLNSTSHSELEALNPSSFILADNFYVLNHLIEQNMKATLFYLDPPYGTGFDFQSRDLEHAYSDNMGFTAYLEFMRRRIILMRECLTDEGSIYIHIGHHMLAHLKILMDEIFGPENFRNLITRRKCSSKNFTKKQYSNINDYILFYSKSRNYKWNQPGITPDPEWIAKEYSKIDDLGRRFKLVPIHAPGIRNGETGKTWRGMNPPPGKHWQYTPDKLEKFDQQGDIHWSRNGNPRRKVYLSLEKKLPLTDYWSSYRDAHHQSIKITGYPTEKNFDMIKMIVEASSGEGDLVIDPFCGSGTTMHAARDLGRQYLGVDASFSAAKASVRRMRHGVEPMGDYVKAQSPVHHLEETHVRENECNFIFDARLLDEFEDEIEEIRRI